MQQRGRPRSFDRDAALDTAMQVFWAKGYEGATVADLTGAMGLKPPSFYGAFGDKGSLFREVVQRYLATKGAGPRRVLEQTTGVRNAVEAMLRCAAELYAAPGAPGGCLVVTAAINCTPEQTVHADDLAARRLDMHAAICERLDQARQAGELRDHADPGALAEFFTTLLQGLALRARDGASHRDLCQSVALGLKVLDDQLVERAPGR